MPVWTVHAPPSPGFSAEPDDDIILIREGFSWTALLFAPLFAAGHRLWLMLALWIAAFVLISLIGANFGGAVGWPLYIGLAIWLGLEAQDFRRGKLNRQDWRLIDVVDAGSAKAAELRYFQKQAAERTTTRPAAVVSPPMPVPRSGGFPPVVGFPSSERP
jgi:hypothetical protein